MKKLLLFALTAVAFGAAAAEPFMKQTEKQINRKGETLTVKEWNVSFHHSGLQLKNTLSSDGKLVKKAWGDFFLGLKHGTIYNGSWDIWQFISATAVKGGSIPASQTPERVVFLRFPDSSSVNMTWKNGEIKVLQASGSADWVYVKVAIPAGIRQVVLTLRPGGSHHGVKGRERWIRYNGKDHASKFYKVNTIPVAEKVDGMAFFNRNYNEKHGNFLVFESEKIARITNNTENPVNVIFYPKPGVKELNFALGYFTNKDAEETIQRFLVEQLPNIRKSLDAVNWNKAPDFTEFSKNADQVKKLIAGIQGADKAKYEKEFAAIQKDYEAAKARNDQNAYAKTLDRLRKLQKTIGSSALNDLM